jgi:hypothetical protein
MHSYPSEKRLTATLGPDACDHVESFISRCGLTSEDIDFIRAPIEGEIWKLGVNPSNGRDEIGRLHPVASLLSDVSSVLDNAARSSTE